MNNRLQRFWTSDRALRLLLWALVLGIFVIIPTLAVSEAPEWGRLVLVVMFSSVLVSGVLASWSDPAARRMVIVAALAPVLLLWFELVYHPPFVAMLSGGVRLGAIATFAAILMARVLAPGPVSKARIQGALAVYLLIGMMFQEGYRLLSIASPGALTVHASNPMNPKFTAELVYFSFSTLTTAGYGDIVPVHPLARSLASLEAITGQMFIVLLIGRLLTLHLAHGELELPKRK